MNNTKQGRKRRANAGFSLIEIMAVVVIIGILAAGAGIVVQKRVSQARVTSTKRTMRQTADAVKTFKMDTGQYPRSLDDLVEQPSYVDEHDWSQYLESVPEDGWGNDLSYEQRGGDFSLKSLGSDGNPGGQGDAADITLEDLKKDDDE